MAALRIPPIAELLSTRRGEEMALNDRYLNPQMGRILRTLGFDRTWVGGDRAHLIDADGQPLPRPDLRATGCSRSAATTRT